MLVRYLPGKFDEKIPLPVQKKVTVYEREGENGGSLALEAAGGRREVIDLSRCRPLMAGKKKIRAWLKICGLFILLVGFCTGTYSIAHKIYSGGFSEMSVLNAIQFIASAALAGYISLVFKATIERCLYGGISFAGGDIYFQSENERAMFSDVLKDGRRE